MLTVPVAVLSVSIVWASIASVENVIPYLEKFELKVGESQIFYDYIGECGVVPQNVKLPKLRTGTLTTGQAGELGPKRCKGQVPALEIIFTATKKGRESFTVNGDDFSVRVRE